MREEKYRVYEAVNFDLSEVVIGVASDEADPHALAEAARRPTWTKDHRQTWRVVEDGFKLDQAAQFALSYLESEAMSAYTVFVGPDLEPVRR